MVWEASDRICSKRLRPLLPILVEAMERHGHLQLVPEVRTRLLAISAATIDRALRDIRQRAGTATRRRSPPSHDLWIDPADPNRMIEGNDGGACVSSNGGRTWSSIYNQPTAQFYRIDTDNQYPIAFMPRSRTTPRSRRLAPPPGVPSPSGTAPIPAPGKAALSPYIPKIRTLSIAARSVPVPAAPGRCSATTIAPGKSSWSTCGPRHP